MTYTSHKNPQAIRSRLEAGLAAHRSGDLSRAITAYTDVLALDPENADALNLLGTGLLQLGRADEAVAPLERAARKDRNNASILANLAQGYIAVKRYGAAEETFRRAIRLQPRELHFQLGLATSLAVQQKSVEATTLLQRLSASFPQSALVWFNLGNALRDQKRTDEAITAYRTALALDPRFVDARNNLGNVLHTALRFREAEAEYRECIALAPDYLLAQFNLASVVMDLGRFDEAEGIARAVVSVAPSESEGHLMLAAALGHQGRLLDALACQRRASALAPHDARAAKNLASTLMETGDAAEGLRWFARAMELNPEPTTRQLLATDLLGYGALQDGWAEYGERPPAIRFREKYPDLQFTRSVPIDLAGRHLGIVREQGIGDEIFFLRYAPRLVARGARITYRASNKIASLLRRAGCIDAFVEEMAPLPACDAQLMIGDLPHALGQAGSTPLKQKHAQRSAVLPELPHFISVFWPEVPRSLSIAPLAEKLARVREQLAAAGSPPYIGVTWRAGTAPEEQNSISWVLYKTIPMRNLADALKAMPGTILALQRKPAEGEIDSFSAALGRRMHDFSALNEELESMLALLSVIDEYVGVSNTNMHLRAAVGKTARVLVPAPAEWRWMQSGRSSPWFPGFSIYRQSLQGDWKSALDALKRDLEMNYGGVSGSKST